MAATVPSRFIVEAVSRHPRRGRDYDSVTHRFSDRYLDPRGYTIRVDAFPGKFLSEPAGDQQVGAGEPHPHDIWQLQVSPGTTGWRFSIQGQPERRLPFGPRPRGFSATATTRLPSRTGQFREDRDDNAWNWQVTVPGPGRYTVTVEITGRGAGSPRSHTLVIRDFVMVSIGDSAASGQGNPDVPGEPEGFDPDVEWWEVFAPP